MKDLDLSEKRVEFTNRILFFQKLAHFSKGNTKEMSAFGGNSMSNVHFVLEARLSAVLLPLIGCFQLNQSLNGFLDRFF
jgi:hypothetical protein